jgi:formiminotetrahydrofolate cyclodeaminase
MAPAGAEGSITIASSSACSSILEFVMNLEKQRDWYAAQAEASVQEVSRLRAALEDARSEVLWYRQRFLQKPAW